MKTKVLDFKNIKRLRTALPKTVSDSSFEEDWANGISGEEVVSPTNTSKYYMPSEPSHEISYIKNFIDLIL